MAEKPPPGRADAPKPKRTVATGLKAISAAGVVAAALIGVSLNVLAARFYERWDWTSRGLYTLSDATLQTLHDLKEPIDVVVFLSASDPLTTSVRHMLAAYGSETTRLRPRFVDPDRSPAEFLALQQQYGILAGKSEDGRVVTDASIVISRGDKRWFITANDIVSYDDADGRATPKLEQALTEGIRNVLSSERITLCFTTGHQEISIDDGGPNGLAELRFRLQKNNFDVEAVDLAAPKLDRPLAECRVVIVAGPEQALSSAAAEKLAAYLRAGGNLLVLANPILDEENRIRPTGLEPVAKVAGFSFGNDFVVERDDKARLPTGLGESFFAAPKAHDVTSGLVRDGEPRFRVLVSAAQSLKREGDVGTPLLSTSDKAFALTDIRPFVDQGKPVEKSATDAVGPFSLALAMELPTPASQKDAKHGPRVVVAGSANLAWGRNWREPTLVGNRLFVESALAWLAARPTLVSVPEKAAHDVGLALTEESLSDVLRYVLIYMPLSAAALGLFVMLRRRAREKQSRADAGEKTPRGAKKKPKEDDD